MIERPIPLAHCTKLTAGFIDPNGSLRRAGLLVVDLEPSAVPEQIEFTRAAIDETARKMIEQGVI